MVKGTGGWQKAIMAETGYMFYGLKLIKIQNKKYLGQAVTRGGAGSGVGQI